MARRLRFLLPGFPAHVIQRGNDRIDCFRRELDYVTYLRMLAVARDREQCRIHAYALMTNHVHLLVTGPRPDSISRMMKAVGEAYVPHFNRTHSRSGTLWEGRFRASIVDAEDYLFTLYRYIEMNPVRAGMVSDPADYRWSSHRANAYGERDDLVSPHRLFVRLDASEPVRRRAYRALFAGSEEPHELDRIRAAVNGGLALGSPEFISKLEQESGRSVDRIGKGRRPRRALAAAPQEIGADEIPDGDKRGLTPVG